MPKMWAMIEVVCVRNIFTLFALKFEVMGAPIDWLKFNDWLSGSASVGVGVGAGICNYFSCFRHCFCSQSYRFRPLSFGKKLDIFGRNTLFEYSLYSLCSVTERFHWLTLRMSSSQSKPRQSVNTRRQSSRIPSQEFLSLDLTVHSNAFL